MINLRRTYLIASALWAVVVGPAVALGVFAFGAGVSWLYLFGDDPWPRAVAWVLPLISLGTGLIAAIGVIWFGWSHGRSLPVSGAGAEYSERRNAILLVIAPIVLFAVFAVSIWTQKNAYEEAMTNASRREARFAELNAGNQRIASLRVEHDNGEDLRAIIEFTGYREGLYRLAWRISPSSFDNAVISDSRELELYEASPQEEIAFSLGELRSGYQALILNGGTGVLVDEPFEFDASLEPIMSAEEIMDLPPGEQQRVGTEESPLASFATARFPVSFLIP